jgi:2-dehydro-3-deoxyphosphogluconate aldolase/(4S)-4-hydroxy-2-oxoglutarate aldolase
VVFLSFKNITLLLDRNVKNRYNPGTGGKAMEYKQLMEKFADCKIIPVIKIEKAESVSGLGQALVNGGLPVAEITFRTSAAEEAIKKIVKEYPDLLVGAGTVLTVENVKKAVDAGATFIVTPGFNPTVVDYCVKHGIHITPGVNSPSQVELGLERGLTVLKFFPAEVSGGIKMLKALAGPYVDVKFVPTGGVNADNAKDYLSQKNVLACGGSWLVKSDLISSGQFDKIESLVKEAVSLVRA